MTEISRVSFSGSPLPSLPTGRSVGEDTQPPLKQTDYIVKLAKDEITRAYDDNCVVLTGRCSKTRRPYLMKYERPPAKVSGLAFDLNLNTFNIAGCYPIDEDYFSWTDTAASGVQVNTSEPSTVYLDARIVGTVALSRCAAVGSFFASMGPMMLSVHGARKDCPFRTTVVIPISTLVEDVADE